MTAGVHVRIFEFFVDVGTDVDDCTSAGMGDKRSVISGTCRLTFVDLFFLGFFCCGGEESGNSKRSPPASLSISLSEKEELLVDSYESLLRLLLRCRF